ncbi:cutinase family protein [Mycobacterium simiae]|uniref:cutinase family protein n=1 Tax=Mycobacterium simiae TaxID=1784 RepID=UPI0005CA0F43|nr:cutinase family protein [Mycobacterium simiae]PLV54523.1 cutinase [Mycobacterium tuberculosis variant microti OV254]BBX41252.1 cutinase [Mycobacterium simiae]
MRARAAAGATAALAVSAVLFGSAAGTITGRANAEPCPDVDVVFARGTSEPPGVGGIGSGFVDALRGQLGGRSLAVYPVNYPASSDFGNPDFPATFIDGIRDASSHLESMAANCPKTREVLGGFSQGAAVAGFVTSAAVPRGISPAAVPKPMPPDVANHVAAVVLFGTPSDQFLEHYGAPAIAIGPAYQAKTLRLCAPGDPVCGGGNDGAAHASYVVNGMAGQAASYAASHL